MKLKVISKTDRFRRAGMQFFKRAPKIIEADKKTYDILKAEPKLTVEVVKTAEAVNKRGK